jgi:3-isopropylmalate dehydrogenase
LPQDTIERCRKADAILLGATGVSTQRGRELILDIRKEFNFFANIRPAVSLPTEQGTPFNFVIVRELAGGFYFGKREEADYQGLEVNESAVDSGTYFVKDIERIARIAFEIAKQRNKKLVSVDKANVFATSRLWRKVVDDVAAEYADITVSHMFIDTMAMQMVKNPEVFDVILTDNLFGDILSDEAAGVVCSLGVMPSASFNERRFALYEPVHGSAPDIAGKNIANPIGMIKSAAMMLEYSFGAKREARAVEKAVDAVLENGYGTKDLEPRHKVGTSEFGELIIKYLKLR